MENIIVIVDGRVFYSWTRKSRKAADKLFRQLVEKYIVGANCSYSPERIQRWIDDGTTGNLHFKGFFPATMGSIQSIEVNLHDINEVLESPAMQLKNISVTAELILNSEGETRIYHDIEIPQEIIEGREIVESSDRGIEKYIEDYTGYPVDEWWIN